MNGHSNRRSFSIAMAACILALGMGAAHAQSFPNRPVRIVVPYPAGGSNDIAARLLAQKLSERMGQQFIVENRAGGGGNIGMEAVANAPADGHTLLLTAPGPLTANYALFKNLPFDPAKAFAPVALVGEVPVLLVVHPSLKVKSVKELIALAKSQPGKINYGSAGLGSSHHMAAELFKHMAEINIVHVPYKGAAPALNDLLAGHVPMMFDSMPGVISHIRAGKILALGVGTPQRSKLLPDVPTISEAGLKGYESPVWYGLVAPAATPEPVLKRLISETQAALKDPDVAKKMTDVGIDPGTVFGADFGKYLAEETAKFTKVIQMSGAKAN